MFPLKDENPTELRPYVTYILIAANAIVFLCSIALVPDHFVSIVQGYGAIPSRIVHGSDVHTLLTSMFLHAGWIHLIGNCWFLYIFGDNIEDVCGHARFVAFYFTCGILAHFLHIASNTSSTIPAIGASGAISGILGAYILLYPKARVLTLVTLGYFWRIVRVPSILFLGLWFLLQLFNGVLGAAAGITAGVAYWAHIGGFLAGIALIYLFKKK
ncbi:MAG: rhomboid family intramembrane serine protease [Methanocellales archaeon]|nr:rhomboid family intramembrane serine protease [Methanocellales archaeon]